MQIPASLRQEASSFTGREWLMAELIAWQRSDVKFFALTGSPGAGKSMVAAWLAGSGPPCEAEQDQAALRAIRGIWSAVFFCSRHLPGAAIDARTFVNDVSSQLAGREPLFADAALAALPSTQKIDVRVEQNLGNVVGVRTTNLLIGGVDTTDAFSIAVKEPLRTVASSAPHRSFFLLVDGLDEARGYGPTSIVDLVASMGDLPANVKIFVSFRRDRSIFTQLGGAAATVVVDLSDTRYREVNRDDVSRYATRRLSAMGTADGGAIAQAVRRVAHAADGNFQYARHLLQEVVSGERCLDDLSGLPHGLELLYCSYLDRLLSAPGLRINTFAWKHLAGVLGPLTVAETPLELSLLARLGGVTQPELAERLDVLQALVHVDADPRPRAGLFHGSMADFFTTESLPEGRANPYFINQSAGHRLIAQYYRTAQTREWHGDWSLCDDYGLANLVYHLSAAVSLSDDHTALNDLYDLASDPTYSSAQRARFGDSAATARMCLTALSVAADRGDAGYVRKLLETLSPSPDAVLRGVAISGLTALHETQPVVATNLLKRMMRSGGDKQSTAFNAVFRIGTTTAHVGKWMALNRVPTIRQTAAYGAYLDWLSGRDTAVADFLSSLALEVRGYRLLKSQRILRYLATATIQIYISQCDELRTAETVHRVWYELVRSRMRAHAATPAFVERLLINSTAGTTMARRISDVALLADLQSPSRFFRSTYSERELFLAGVDLLEPDADLAASEAVVASLLQSEILFHRVLGSSIVSTWAHRDLSAAEPVLRRTFAALSSEGQLWHLFSFATLFSSSDPSWRSFVEWQTSCVLERDSLTKLVQRGELPPNFNVALLPLGLACGRAGVSMTIVESYLQDALAEDDDLASYLLEGLGYIGFYCPEPALSALSLATSHRERSGVRIALAGALGTMAVIRPTLVDLFLLEHDCPDLHPLVRAAVDIDMTKQYVDRIGFFNNSINQAVMHPIMRDGLLLPSLRILGQARSQREYIRRYTPLALRLLRDYDYNLLDWWAGPNAVR